MTILRDLLQTTGWHRPTAESEFYELSLEIELDRAQALQLAGFGLLREGWSAKVAGRERYYDLDRICVPLDLPAENLQREYDSVDGGGRKVNVTWIEVRGNGWSACFPTCQNHEYAWVCRANGTWGKAIPSPMSGIFIGGEHLLRELPNLTSRHWSGEDPTFCGLRKVTVEEADRAIATADERPRRAPTKRVVR